jgi:putative RNA 2'-phosphotransferase
MNEKDIKNKSKFLSLVLRHSPETIGITLDENGWVDVQELLDSCNKKGRQLNLDTLKLIVETNDKKRFSFNEDLSKIRANQGHSVQVDLGLDESCPLDILYHGTVAKFMDSIKANGLQKMNRQHVHLSKDVDTANTVASRRGLTVLLKIDAKRMHGDGYKFYLSENGVWLTDEVPPQYMEVILFVNIIK